MKKARALLLALLVVATSCESELTNEFDVAQKPAKVNIKGFSTPDAIEIRLDGKPVIINENTFYTQKIETTLNFVLDKGEKNPLAIYNHETGTQIAIYEITYDNSADYENFYFFNLPDIFLEVYAVKPTINLGKVGFKFLFANLGEFSGTQLESVKGVLKRENGAVLATFENIGKDDFSEFKIYNFFSNTAPVFLELYKPGTTEPYTGASPIKVQIIQTYGVNMIVLQEKQENGTVVIKGDIDIADYL